MILLHFFDVLMFDSAKLQVTWNTPRPRFFPPRSDILFNYAYICHLSQLPWFPWRQTSKQLDFIPLLHSFSVTLSKGGQFGEPSERRIPPLAWLGLRKVLFLLPFLCIVFFKPQVISRFFSPGK